MPILRSNETVSIWGGAAVVGHEKLVVDGGAVHIDADDSEHVIRIIHEKDDGVDILAAIDEETDTKTVHIDSGGTYHGDKVAVSEVAANVIKFGAATANTNLETYLDAAEQNQNAVDVQVQQQVASLASRVAATETPLQAATHLDDGAANTLVLRNQATGTSVDNLHVVADDTNYTESFPPAGLYFTKGLCHSSLDLVQDAQLNFLPYDANGDLITGRTYVFGRAQPEVGETYATTDHSRDGLTIADENVSHSCEIFCSNTQPTIQLVGTKLTETTNNYTRPVCPVFEIQNGNNDTVYAIFDDGYVVQSGHTDTDPDALLSGHFSGIVVGPESVYIGRAKISYSMSTHTTRMQRLKAAIPVYLVARGVTAGQVPLALAQMTVHGWVALGRTLLSDIKLSVTDVFPSANADWDPVLFDAHAASDDPVLTGQLALGKAAAEGGITVDIESGSDVHLQLARTGFPRALLTRHSDGYIGFSVANGANAGQKLHINDDGSLDAYGTVDIPAGRQYRVGGSQIAMGNLSDGGSYSTTTQMNTALAAKADLAGPTFTGVPAAPTAAVGTDSTQLATTGFVQDAIEEVVGSAPAALDTLLELSAALGDDASFASTITNSLSLKRNITDSYSRTEIVALNTTQDGVIALNTAKTTYDDAAEVEANTAKVGISSGQASAIVANTAKVA